jgi:hypothetical protein
VAELHKKKEMDGVSMEEERIGLKLMEERGEAS